MKPLRKAVYTIYAALFGLAGVRLLLYSRRPSELADRVRDEWLELLTPGSLQVAGLVLLCAALLPLLLKIAELRRSRCLAFETSRGEVAIRLDTVEEFIRRVVVASPEVAEVKSVVIPRRRAGVEVMLELILNDGSKIPSLTEGLQRAVESQMNELLGIENISRVQINILNIKPGGEE